MKTYADVSKVDANARLHGTSLELLWITTGFHNPECAVFDHERNEIYLSCMASDGQLVPVGRGYIARLTPTGKIIEDHWIGNLKNPCGLAVQGRTLYIVDCDRLLEADVVSGEIMAEHAAPEAIFLDGMSVNRDGSCVYVSDIFGNAVWRLSRGIWEKWLEDPRFNQPDGMVAERDRLVVGGFAMSPAIAAASAKGVKSVKGHLVVVDYATRLIGDLGKGTPIANHDGLCSDGADGYLTSDYIDGTLLRVSAAGDAHRLATFDYFDDPYRPLTHGDGPPTSCGPADIRYYAEHHLLLVPLLNVGKLAAYRYEFHDPSAVK